MNNSKHICGSECPSTFIHGGPVLCTREPGHGGDHAQIKKASSASRVVWDDAGRVWISDDRTPATKVFCGASAPCHTDGSAHSGITCILPPGHTGEHCGRSNGFACTWDDDGRFAARRIEKTCYAPSFFERVERVIAGNARVTLDRDRHGVFIADHSTRGAFRAATLQDALGLLLDACGVDGPAPGGHASGDGSTHPE